MKRSWMIATQIIYILSLFPWLIVRGVSYMLAYDGELYPNARFLFGAVSAYPLVMIASSIWAWISYRREKSSRAGKIFLIPIGYILLVILLVQIGIFG